MIKITETVKHLIIINVIVFFGSTLLLGPNKAYYYLGMHFPSGEFFKPYQIITHMFMHGDIGHLFFNMFGLYMFGSFLENYIGSKKFLQLYFIAGFGALLLHVLVWYYTASTLTPREYADFLRTPYSVIGASGAIFGLLAGFATLLPNVVVQLIFPPIPLKAKWMAIGYAGIELYSGFNGLQTGVAHFAHVGGALFGFLVVMYWKKIR